MVRTEIHYSQKAPARAPRAWVLGCVVSSPALRAGVPGSRGRGGRRRMAGEGVALGLFLAHTRVTLQMEDTV